MTLGNVREHGVRYVDVTALGLPADDGDRQCYTCLAVGGAAMPKGEQRGNREAKKPKKEKPQTIAAAPSMKGSAGSTGGSKK